MPTEVTAWAGPRRCHPAGPGKPLAAGRGRAVHLGDGTRQRTRQEGPRRAGRERGRRAGRAVRRGPDDGAAAALRGSGWRSPRLGAKPRMSPRSRAVARRGRPGPTCCAGTGPTGSRHRARCRSPCCAGSKTPCSARQRASTWWPSRRWSRSAPIRRWPGWPGTGWCRPAAAPRSPPTHHRPGSKRCRTCRSARSRTAKAAEATTRASASRCPRPSADRLATLL